MPDIFDQLDTPPARSGGDVFDQVASPAGDIFDELPTGNRLADMGRRVLEGASTGTGRTLQGARRGLEVLAPSEMTEDQFIASQLAGLNAKAFPNGLSPVTTPLTRADVPPAMLEQWRADYARQVGTVEQRLQESPTYQLGAETVEAARAVSGVDRNRDDEFLAQLATAAGEMVPTLAAGALGGPVAAGAQYAATAGESQAQEAIAAGKTEVADVAFLSAAGLGGLTEAALGVPGRLLAIVKRARQAGVNPGAFGKWANRNPMLAGIAKAGAAGAVREGTQEGLEQVGGNLIASDVAGYDPQRPVDEGVARAMALGAALGGPLAGGGAAVNQTARNMAARRLKQERAGRDVFDEVAAAVPKTGTGEPTATPVTSAGTPQAEPVAVTRDLAAELQAALTGNQGKPVGEEGRGEKREDRPAQALPSTEPLRFRAIVEEGKVPSEMVVQPLTEELYDAVIHVEGLTPDFEQFKAENPEATHLRRLLMPTGKFASGHKFGPLNELVPQGIGSKWEQVEDRGKRVEDRPAAALPSSVSPLSSPPAPAAQLTPASPAPTVTPAETETVTAGTAGREAGTQGGKEPTASPTPANSGLATEPGVSPGPISEISQAGRTSLGKAASTVSNGPYRRSTTTEADDLLHTLATLGLRLPYFKPDRGAVTYFDKLTAKARRNEPLTPKEKATLELFRRTFPVNFEDNYGAGGEIMEAAYKAAQRAGLAVELFTEQRGQLGGEWDTKLDALRQATGRDWTLRELYEALPPLAEGHRARVRGETSAEENAELDKRAEQDMAFQRDQRTNLKNSELIAPDDLREGMSYTLRGRKLRVTDLDIDEDGRVVAVELEDGDRYGTQRLLAEDGSEVPALRADTGSAVGTASQKRAEQQEGGAFSRKSTPAGRDRATVNWELNQLKAKATRTPTENARITALEAELGQQDLFAVETRDVAEIEREAKAKADKAELERRRAERLTAAPIEVQDNLFGEPLADKSGQGMFFSRRSDRDAEYLAAVERGDMATAQRMVDEAAKAAGYDAGPVYHGTPNGEFHEFSPVRQGATGTSAKAFWFTESESMAENFSRLSPSVEGGKPRVVRAFLSLGDTASESDFSSLPAWAIGMAHSKRASVIASARRRNRSSVKFLNMFDFGGPATVYAVFSPSQIKSADPVTYDDAGRVIPLSERFNPESNDIRNSRAEAAAEPAVSVASAQARADELTAKWVLPFGVEVVQSWRDLPARARRGITEQDGHTVEGRYVPGSGVFLVADNLASPDRVAAVVLHEVLGHFGIDTVLGEQRDDFMLDVFRSFQGKPLFQQKVRDYAGDFENGRTPVTPADKILLGRELVAALAENPAENPGLWQRIVDAVRRWLREIGWVQDVTEADIREALRRADRELRGVRSVELGVRSPGLVNLGGGVLMTPGAQLVGIRPAPLSAVTAHHGTPHKVDRFTTAKIGTGEGAQVYGWGLYFAENPKVAEEYKKQMEWRHLDRREAAIVEALGIEPNKDVVRVVSQLAMNGKSARQAQYAAAELRTVPEVKINAAFDIALNWTGGNTYTVTLNVEPEDLLDWDKPLSEQSEKVRKALAGVIKIHKRAVDADAAAGAGYSSQAAYERAMQPDGSEIYGQILKRVQSPSATPQLTGLPPSMMMQEYNPRAASEFLAFLGIKGIRYLDQGSRGFEEPPSRSQVAAIPSTGGFVVIRDASGRGWAAGTSEAEAWQRFDAIPRPTYNYVIFNEDDIRITHENGQAVAAGQFSRAAQPEVKNLVVAHNLTAEKLRNVLKLGALPVPSLAVIRTDRSQFDAFGDVTLLGPPGLVDNRADKDAKVFNADVYSPRYPTVKYLLDEKAKKRVREAIAPMLDKLPPDRRKDFSVWTTLSEVEDKGLEKAMLEDKVLAAAFLMDKGQAVAWRPVSEDNQRYQQQMSRSDVMDMVRPTYDGNQPVDGPVRAEFKQWIADLIKRLDLQPTEKIFAGFTNSGNKRYLPHDLDTVVKQLKKGLKDGEGFNYGVPSIRAKTAKQFRTIASMQAAREDIISTEAMEKVKEEANAEFERLHDEAMPNRTGGKNSGYGTMDAFSDDLKAMVEGDFSHLRKMYPGGEPFAAMREFLDKLRNLPTEYFEAKVQRPVALQEFDAAVVPDDFPEDLRAELKRRGLSVVTYPKRDKEARRAAVEQAAQAGGMAFSRTTQPTEPLADLLARRDEAAARGITYTAQREKLRAAGKSIPDSLKKAEREQADIFKEASFQLLRHPDYVAQQVRAVDAKLDELNTLVERRRILKQQGTDLESDARARLAELEHWLPIETGEEAVPFQHADEFAGIPPSLVKQAIERTPGLKHFVTEADKKRMRAILDNPNLTQAQKDKALEDLERNRGRQLAEVPFPNALPPRANVALATSTTLAGNQDARGWWESFARYARNLASATPEIPLTGPLARLNVPMRGFLNAIRAGNMTAARDAETMVRDVVQPLLDLPREQLDPNALARHQAIAKKLQFAERQFDQQAERMRAEIAAMEQARASRDAINERREALAEFEGNPPAKIAELQKQLAEAVNNLGTNPMWLFKQAVLFRDYVSRFQMLAPKQQGRFKFPGNLSIQDVVNELARTEEAIEASPARVAIKEAMDRHYRAMTELEGELLKRGHLIPEAMKNGAYFPHQVLDYTSQHLGRLKPATDAPFRGYLVDPTGSRKAIETDYIQAVYRHAAEVMAHNAHQDAVEKYLKPLDRSESIRETVEAKAAAEGRTAGRFEWRSEDNLPPGFVFYDAAKKLPLRLGYVLDPQTIAQALGIALKDGDVVEQMRKLGVDFVVEPEMLQQALVAGEKQPWVIPKEVAEALDGILDRQKREEAAARAPVTRRLRQAVALWKLNTLFAPWHYIRYEWGNTMSDIVDKLGGADPGMAKYLPQAFKEVIAFADRKEATKDVRAAFEQRVLDSVTFAEVEKVKDSPAFEQLRSDTQRALATAGNFAKDATFPAIPIIRLLSGANVRSTVELSRLREATFRYAKFLADLDRIRNGQRPVYAGAYWKDVEAEGTPEEKAAFIARRTFGDYGDLSVAGDWLRQNLVPFYSWTEINFRYHANLLRNMADMIRKGEFGDAAQSARAIAAWTALRLALPYAAVHLWNTIGGAMAGAWDDDDDLEATLSEADRRRFHIILGKDDRGQTRVVYLPTAFSDVVSWFGGDNAARLLAEYARGEITFERVVGDFAKQIGPDVVNKVAQSTGPVGKGAFIAVSGKQPFPDITNMRSVSGREKWFAVVQTMTDREGTDLLRRAFDNDYYPRPAGEVAQQLILQIRRRDPEQWAFYEVKEKVSDWKERKTGKRFEAGDYSAPEAQALRSFRRAVYLGDVDAAERFYTRLLGFGYTSERLKASIRNQHPLAELNEEGRKEFIKGLSRADREQLRRALQYWERLGTLKGKERGLFPAKVGQRFTPQPERLQRAVLDFDRKSDEEVRRQAERLVESALTGRR